MRLEDRAITWPLELQLAGNNGGLVPDSELGLGEFSPKSAQEGNHGTLSAYRMGLTSAWLRRSMHIWEAAPAQQHGRNVLPFIGKQRWRDHFQTLGGLTMEDRCWYINSLAKYKPWFADSRVLITLAWSLRMGALRKRVRTDRQGLATRIELHSFGYWLIGNIKSGFYWINQRGLWDFAKLKNHKTFIVRN